MDYQRDPSSHWNSYRPTYDAPPPQEPRGRPPQHIRNQARPAPTSSGPPVPSDHDHGAQNPNMEPVAPRYFSSYTSPDRHDNSALSPHHNPRAPPQLWNPALDALISRTTRAYDLVINYARDSEGGTRWSASSIALVHSTGKHLHANIRGLKAWQRRCAADWDYFAIQEDEDQVRAFCAEVLGVIDKTEVKMEWELAAKRGGEKEKDKDKDKEGREHGKMGMEGLKHQRRADRRARPQKKKSTEGVRRRDSSRQRQAREPESDRSNGKVVVGRLGKHVLHY
jgi:hypothetical protein